MTELRPVEFEIQTLLEWDDWKHTCLPRLRRAKRLKIPHLPQLVPHKGKCIVVGAAPSVKDHVDKIADLLGGSNVVLSVNGAHDWLIKNGIHPNIHVISEMDLEDVTIALGGPSHKAVTYYIASYCSPSIFKQLDGCARVLWHAFCPPQGYQQAIAENYPGEFMVAGGFCTFFRSMTIAIILGYREIELFGVDSSFEDSSHVDGYALANKEARVTLWGANPSHTQMKKFVTQGGLAFQAREFIDFCKHNQAGLQLRIHGGGLLRYLHESRYPEQYMKGT